MEHTEAVYEMIGGHMLRCRPVSENERRLSVLLGTLVEDHLRGEEIRDQILPGPGVWNGAGYDRIQYAFLTVAVPALSGLLPGSRRRLPEAAEAGERECFPREWAEEGRGDGPESAGGADGCRPVLFVKVLTEADAPWAFLDIPQILRDRGAAEYWLIDLKRQCLYMLCLAGRTQFRRYSFEQTVQSSIYPGLSLCLARIMQEKGGALEELSVFSRYQMEKDMVREHLLIAEDMRSAKSRSGKEGTYTAAQFLRWLKVRRHLPRFREMTELLLGKIADGPDLPFIHQFLQGNLYFALKSYLKESQTGLQICFSPMAVELTGRGMLDSVLRPDIFVIPEPESLYENVYRGAPLWVIEIADPSTASRDYLDKEQIYHYFGVGEYWIVNDWKKQVMVIRYCPFEDGRPLPGPVPDGAGQAGREPVPDEWPQTRVYTYEEEIPICCLPGRTLQMGELADP